MKNDMRNRLVKLIEDSLPNDNHIYFTKDIEDMADYLIANGVILSPCKVGDEVWCLVFSPCANKLVVKRGFVDEIKIKHEKLNIKIVDCIPIKYANLNITVNENDFGKTVFLTQEQAEQKLKELSEDG